MDKKPMAALRNLRKLRNQFHTTRLTNEFHVNADLMMATFEEIDAAISAPEVDPSKPRAWLLEWGLKEGFETVLAGKNGSFVSDDLTAIKQKEAILAVYRGTAWLHRTPLYTNGNPERPGWEKLPEDLKTHLFDFLKACQIAKTNSKSSEDRSYWDHQIKIIKEIESQLSLHRTFEDT